jgi:nucleoid-associated protein YgaU
MYAAGYAIKIRPRPQRRGFRLGGAKRTLAVLGAVAAANLALALVVHGGTPAVYTEVVVQPGDTVWSIASEHYPGDDVRNRVDDIERLNGLQSPLISTGQTLRLPS